MDELLNIFENLKYVTYIFWTFQEFMEMLLRDLSQRVQNETESASEES